MSPTANSRASHLTGPPRLNIPVACGDIAVRGCSGGSGSYVTSSCGISCVIGSSGVNAFVPDSGVVSCGLTYPLPPL